MRKLRWIPVSLLLVLGWGLDPKPGFAGCWVCDQVESGTMDCANLEGESGGTGCSINCSTVFGVNRCTCRTSGICGAGSTGCGGPCPQAEVPDVPIASLREELLEQALDRAIKSANGGDREPGGHFRLNPGLLGRIERGHPDAAALISGIAQSSGTFVPGEFRGLLSVEPENAVRKTKPRIYPFEARVTSENDGLRIEVTVDRHPVIESISAYLWAAEEWSRLEVLEKDGKIRSYSE